MALKAKALRTIDDLTPKQRKFVDILVANWGEITKAEACKRAGYEAKNDKNFSDIGSRLTLRRHNPHVVKYLDQELEKAKAKYEKDRLRRYKRLEKYADNAFSDKQYAAAINAEFRSGQLAGLYVDKKEVKVSVFNEVHNADLSINLGKINVKTEEK